MSKEVLIPKKWVWDGVCTYSTRYEFLSKYFIKQPATAGTAGQVLALNSDLNKNHHHLPNEMRPDSRDQLQSCNKDYRDEML